MAETKNIVVVESSVTPLGGVVSVQMNVPEDIQKNFHNIWINICVNPVDADANAEGTWVLYREEDATRALMDVAPVTLNLETVNYKIIACGCWFASNQTPFNLHENMGRTSRNIRQNGRLILITRVNARTAGNTSIVLMLCAGSNTF